MRQRRGAYSEKAVVTGLPAFAGNDNSDNAGTVARWVT
jgi:hypothetical protein